MENKKEENADIIQFINENIYLHNDNSFQNQKHSNNNSIFYDELNEEKVTNLRSQYKMFKIYIYKKLYKKEYKTVLNQIEGNYQIYINLPEIEEMIFLKIEVLLKILLNKIKKINRERTKKISKSDSCRYKSYSFSKNTIKLFKEINKKNSICNIKLNRYESFNLNIIVSIEKYYLKIYKEFNYLINNIQNIFQNSQIIYIEKIIQLYLKFILIKNYHHEKIFQTIYSNYFLSLGIKLIYSFKDYIKDTITLELYQEIYLNIAKNLIKNKDFKKAENKCIKVYNLCIRELIFKYGNLNLLGNNLNSNEKKVFLHLSLSFLYIGICKEERGKINKSLKYYKLVLFLSQKFLKNGYNKFSNFINNIIFRVENYKNIFNGLQTKGIEYIKGKSLDNNLNDINDKNNPIIMNYKFKPENNYNKTNILKKNLKLQKYIKEISNDKIKKNNDSNIDENKTNYNFIKLKVKKQNMTKNININSINLKSYINFIPNKIKNQISEISTRNLSNIQLSGKNKIDSEKKINPHLRVMSAISMKENQLNKINSTPNLIAIDDSFKTPFNFTFNQLFNNLTKNKASSNKKQNDNVQNNNLNYVFIKKVYLNNIKNNKKISKKNKNKQLLFSEGKVSNQSPIISNLKKLSMKSITSTSPFLSERIISPNKVSLYQKNIKKNKTIILTPFCNSSNFN